MPGWRCRPVRTVVPPAAWMAWAIALPIPRPPPVMMAIWSLSGSGLVVVFSVAPAGDGFSGGFVLLGHARQAVERRLVGQREREAAGVEVDLRDTDLDFLVELEAFARMVAPGRREDVRDVQQPEDPRLELDEDAVLLDARDPSAHERTHLVLRGGVQPRVVGQLLEANGHAPR